MAVRSAWSRGAASVPGSARLILLRWLLWIGAALPGAAAAGGALEDSLANRPYFVEAGRPLGVIAFGRLVGGVPGPVWGALLAGAALAWLGNLMLTAGAVEIFTQDSSRVRVLRRTCGAGGRWLWLYLRIAVLAALLLALGAMITAAIFGAIADHGELAGWTHRTTRWRLPIARALVLIGWATAVGVFAWWCRVAAVAGGKRGALGSAAPVLRAWVRYPVQGFLLHALMAVFSLLGGAAVLYGWRQSGAPPGRWIAPWLVVLLFQSVIWHWRLRAGCLLWAVSGRAGPPEPPPEASLGDEPGREPRPPEAPSDAPGGGHPEPPTGGSDGTRDGRLSAGGAL